MRRCAVVILLTMIAWSVVGATEPAEVLPIESDRQKAMYGMGLRMAMGLEGIVLTDEDLALLQAGLADALRDRPRLELQEVFALIGEVTQQMYAEEVEQRKKQDAPFGEQAAAEAGAVTMASGGIYLELEQGAGESPSPPDVVQVNYRGSLTDGTVFESTVDAGKPAEFQVMGVINCFKEGLLRMREGGKAKLTCPAESAYGNHASGRVPAGATIIFELELLKIVRSDRPADPPSG